MLLEFLIYFAFCVGFDFIFKMKYNNKEVSRIDLSQSHISFLISLLYMCWSFFSLFLFLILSCHHPSEHEKISRKSMFSYASFLILKCGWRYAKKIEWEQEQERRRARWMILNDPLSRSFSRQKNKKFTIEDESRSFLLLVKFSVSLAFCVIAERYTTILIIEEVKWTQEHNKKINKNVKDKIMLWIYNVWETHCIAQIIKNCRKRRSISQWTNVWITSNDKTIMVREMFKQKNK